MTQSQTNRIEKRIELKAPVSRVWRAVTDHSEFGAWFGVQLEGPFVPGQHVKGRITHPGYEHIVIDLLVERLEPERLFSFRGHPAPPAPGEDPASVPTTVVEFRFEPRDTGTLLVLTESGFDAFPPAQRRELLQGNDAGWSQQEKNIRAYLEGA